MAIEKRDRPSYSQDSDVFSLNQSVISVYAEKINMGSYGKVDVFLWWL